MRRRDREMGKRFLRVRVFLQRNEVAVEPVEVSGRSWRATRRRIAPGPLEQRRGSFGVPESASNVAGLRTPVPAAGAGNEPAPRAFLNLPAEPPAK